jgi:hypothetical protein
MEGEASAADRHEPGGGRAPLSAPLRWLARKLSGLVRWAAKRFLPRWVPKHVPAPLRWLGRLLAPGRERGFGFWWLVATLAIAGALGLIVALLLTPVAGLIALLVVAIWALVRAARSSRSSRGRDTDEGTPAGAQDAEHRGGCGHRSRRCRHAHPDTRAR